MKKLIVYMPLTYRTISKMAVNSLLSVTSNKVRKQFAELDIELDVFTRTVFPLDYNGNDAISRMKDAGADYIFFMDCDEIVPEDAIIRLFKHLKDDIDVVSGLYFLKTPPFHAAAGYYMDWNENLLKYKKSLASQGFVAPDGNQTLFYYPVSDFSKPHLIDAAGLGCLLIKTSVFDKIEQPYLRHINAYSTQDYTFPVITEDMWLFSKLYEKGVKILLDPSVECGHIRETVITQKDYKDWKAHLESQGIIIKQEIYAEAN